MFNQAVLKSEKRFNQMGKKMKKFTYAMLGAVLLLAGCRYHEFYYDEEALNAENNAAAESSALAAETTVTAIPVNDPAASAAEEKWYSPEFQAEIQLTSTISFTLSRVRQAAELLNHALTV